MKTLLFLLLIGAISTAFGWQYYRENQHLAVERPGATTAESRQKAWFDKSDTVANREGEERLTPDNIREELAKTGRVVRSRLAAAGERRDDAQIVAFITSQYADEKNLSSFVIGVECRDGTVTLSGAVNFAEQIGQAVKMALRTEGVDRVVSHLEVKF